MTDAATLIRCSSCLTPVYAGEKNCRHCGIDLGRPRPLLTRRAWFMIGGAVLAFAIGDTIYLVQKRKTETTIDYRITRDLLRSVFRDDLTRARQLVHDGSDLVDELPALRSTLHIPDGSLEVAINGFTRLESRGTHAFRYLRTSSVYYDDARIYRFEVALTSKSGTTSLRFFGEACVVADRGHTVSCLRLQQHPLTGTAPHCPNNLDR